MPGPPGGGTDRLGLLGHYRNQVVHEVQRGSASLRFLRPANLAHRVAKVAKEVRIGRQQHARIAGRQGIVVSLPRPIEGEKLRLALVGCGLIDRK